MKFDKFYILLGICFFSLFIVSVYSFVFYFSSKKLYSENDYLFMSSYKASKGDIEASKFFLKKAFAKNSNNLKVNTALAFYYYNKGKYDKALKHFNNLLESYLKHSSSDNLSSLFYNVGYLKYQLGNVRESMSDFKRSIEIDPDNLSSLKWLGFAHLMHGEFKEGYLAEDAAYNIKLDRDIISRQWDGSDVSGKTILLHDNIGIGDVFCFVRYAKILKEKGARVILFARPFLFPILSLCPYIDGFFDRSKKAPEYDESITINRLPRMINKVYSDVSVDIPYMNAEQKLVDKWNMKLSKDKKFKIGVCWSASVMKDKKTGKVEKNKRSMPLHYFYPFSKLENVSLYSLQQANGMDQLKYIPHDFSIKLFDEKFDKKNGSFMDTAAVMKNLDLVITVDTSVCHIAGALGVPVWVVLPFVPDWRWLLDRSDTHWYPTMKLFRQKKLGDWELVMEEVYEELKLLADKHASS